MKEAREAHESGKAGAVAEILRRGQEERKSGKR